jgi:methionine sulfoxide reductase heme-binding subunit
MLIDGAWHDTLGANPIEKITHETGFWTLTLLLIGLSMTPLRQISAMTWPARLRRLLGLLAFFYACLHIVTYLVLDQFFDWANIGRDIAKRPYITIGFAAFVSLIPLALTSSNAMQRKLGGKRWQRLHLLVYPIATAGVVHFAWLVKKDLTRPLIFAGILAVLLIIRCVYWLKRHSKQRRQSSPQTWL